jgi:hypothetical protein
MKSWLFSLIAVLSFAVNAHAGKTPFHGELEQRFINLENEKTVRLVYDVTSNSTIGATGTYGTGVRLPAGAIITRSFAYINTLFAGSGTLAVHCEDANNIFTAFTMSSRAEGTIVDGTATGTTTTMARGIAAPCEVTLTVGSSTITAGKATIYFTYVKP